MKLITWNVNGIRSVFRKSFRDWLMASDPDIVCIQEIKADDEALTAEFAELEGYHAYFHSAQKKGYSGVAVYTKAKPHAVERKLGLNERFDDEGRGLKLVFDSFTLYNFYIPNGARDQRDMSYKLEVYRQLMPMLRDEAAAGPTILCGDFNVAHDERDLHAPQHNQQSTMFTPPERAQIDALLAQGYVDTFRALHPEKREYTWWPYTPGARDMNMGWRIDYVFVSRQLKDKVVDAFTGREIEGSDHGPYGVVLDVPFDVSERPIYTKQETRTRLF